mmetsp:Transcript_10526/g.42955  ORF Transcript_10526/g.42955 Transcript_10526/m.42955 type:complete len:234 (+) Transcript_10526:441-1142(+)
MRVVIPLDLDSEALSRISNCASIASLSSSSVSLCTLFLGLGFGGNLGRVSALASCGVGSGLFESVGVIERPGSFPLMPLPLRPPLVGAGRGRRLGMSSVVLEPARIRTRARAAPLPLPLFPLSGLMWGGMTSATPPAGGVAAMGGIARGLTAGGDLPPSGGAPGCCIGICSALPRSVRVLGSDSALPTFPVGPRNAMEPGGLPPFGTATKRGLRKSWRFSSPRRTTAPPGVFQ